MKNITMIAAVGKNKELGKEQYNLKELSRAINAGFYDYEYSIPYNGIDLDFINISNSI